MTAESGHSHRLNRIVLTVVLLLPFLPLAGCAEHIWGWAVGHLLLAVLGLVAYELVVLAAGVAVQAHGELRKRWSDGFAEAIGAALRRRFSLYGRRYRRFLVEAHRDVDLRGPAARLPLDEVFVEPIFANADGHGIWDHLRDSAGRALQLVGEPGAGKTTLLKHMTLTMARNRRAGWPVGAPRHKTPILLTLRDHAAPISADPSISVAELARRSARPARFAEPPRWFDQQLEAGRCVVLLDGLDEVRDARVRTEVLRWAERQAAGYERCRFMVTLRPPYTDTAALRLCPFTAEQTAAFARSWNTAMDRYRPAGSFRLVQPPARRRRRLDEAWRSAAWTEARLVRPPARRRRDDARRSAAGAEALIAALMASPELGGNPLLLAMAAHVRRLGAPIPAVRRELYAQTCKALLTPRGKPDQVIPALTADQAEHVLSVLAAVMTERGIAAITAVEAADVVAPSLAELRPQLDPQDFLASVAQGSGLLLVRPGGAYCFAHLTLQDHLSSTAD